MGSQGPRTAERAQQAKPWTVGSSQSRFVIDIIMVHAIVKGITIGNNR